MRKKTAVITACALWAAIVFSACSGDAEAPPERAVIREESFSESQEYADLAGNEETPAPAAVYEDGLEEDGRIHVYLVGDGETVYTPDSSFIDYLTWYEDSGHLIICMKGKEYAFANVSESLWKAFTAADSKGSFYNAEIKGKSQYLINDYDGTNGDLIVMEHIYR